MTTNELEIKNSLKAMQIIFAGLEDYRVVGSILVASMNGKPHRELHDVDLLVDKRIYQQVLDGFEKAGFKRVKKHAPGFKWDEFQKYKHLTFGTLLIGTFEENYFVYKANRWLTLQIRNEYLAPTDYVLFDLKVRGIPPRSAYEGIKAASLNSKRKKDKEIVRKYMGHKTEGLSINHAFRVKIFGITAPYLYTLFSHVYNLIGGIRLRFGKSYDPWT